MAYKQTPLNMGSSPLKGNYESGVDGIRYVSTAPAFQDMQNKIAGGTAKAIDGLKPKEPDTSKETNSSDYDRNSTVNNYYYGNQPQSGFGGFDDVSESVSQIGEPLKTGQTPTMSASSGGGGSSDTIKNRTKTNVRLSDSQAWKGLSSKEQSKYGSLGNFKIEAQKYRDNIGVVKFDKQQAETTGVNQVGTRVRKYETKNEDPEKLISDITTGNYYGN